MSRPRLFVRRKGRVQVRLNDAGREVAREAFGHVVAAERDPDHDWTSALTTPIDPSADSDDPVAALERQQGISTNAELAVATLHEEWLSDGEAWAWLTTLQVALRATAVSHGLLTDEALEACGEELLHQVRSIQAFLFDLAECL